MAVDPTLAALQARGIDYRGVLYAGLMLTEHGPRVLEFNVRFGDPESQVVLLRWQGDVTAVLAAAAAGRLDYGGRAGVHRGRRPCAWCWPPRAIRTRPRWASRSTVWRPPIGARASSSTRRVSAPGRLAGAWSRPGAGCSGVGAGGRSLAEARQAAYDAVGLVSWPDMTYRRDIAGAPLAARA